jgi:TolB-like protein/Tfp pilus assembly protein PilF
MSLAAGARLGPYQILAPLGSGGMGEVYRARDSRLDRDVAIKVLPQHLAADPEALARFEREAKAVAALSHPNILAIHDFGNENGIAYAVMELLQGESLGTRLKQGGALDWRAAVEIGVAVADGLAEAHAKGIIHRDLKPENVFLTSDGRVKILDFGLARMQAQFLGSQDRTSSNLQRGTAGTKTTPGTILGTVGYMSPEQVRGEPAQEPSDIFSLGCVLYEMLSGVKAFGQATTAEVLAAILKEDPPPLSATATAAPGELHQVVSKCLAKKPDERYRSAREVMGALRRIGSAPVVVQQSAPAVAPPRKGRAWAVAGIAAVAVLALAAASSWILGRGGGIESIAVLPFVNAGGDPGTEYLSDGITEGIINSLAQLPQLGVMSRSSVFRYKGKDVDPRQAGRELGVQAVLLGRVTRRGDGLVVSAELVDVQTNRQIWGEQYNRPMADAQNVQAEIAREISDRLKLRLSGEDKERLARRRTENSEAYQLYLQGRFQWNKRTLEGMQQSIELFQQAIAKDSRYALVHAGLADAYALLADFNVLPAREVMPRAKQAALEALKLDDSLAEAHASLGWAKLVHDWAWTDAEAELRRAVTLNPNYATGRHWYAEYFLVSGRAEQALAEARRAVELEPVSLPLNRALASALLFAGRTDAAAEQARKAIGLDTRFAPAHGVAGRAWIEKGTPAEAIAEFQKALDLSEGNSNELAALGYGYAAAGRRAEAQKVLDELHERSKQTYVQPVWLAVIYGALGDKDQAFQWLDQGYQDRSGWLAYLKVDPVFRPLQGDARFTDLTRRVGLP